MLCRLRGDIVADRVHDGDFALKHDRAGNQIRKYEIILQNRNHKHLFKNVFLLLLLLFKSPKTINNLNI